MSKLIGLKEASIRQSTELGIQVSVVTLSSLEGVLQGNVKGAEFITAKLETKVRMNKNGLVNGEKVKNPYEGVAKFQTVNGMIKHNYKNSVNNQAGREDKEEREIKAHPWGDMDEQGLFRVNRRTGAKHLSIKVEKSTIDGYKMPNGEAVTHEQIKPFLPKKSTSSTQKDLTKKVIVIDPALANVKALHMRKEKILQA